MFRTTALMLFAAALPALGAEIAVTVRDADFVRNGFAEINLRLKDAAPDGAVTWSVTAAQNRGTAVADNFRTRRTGLNWQKPAATGTAEVGPLETTDTAVRLTDILGERTVTVEARWTKQPALESAGFPDSVQAFPQQTKLLRARLPGRPLHHRNI